MKVASLAPYSFLWADASPSRLPMALHYKTIAASSTGSYKEKGSKFLAFAFPVSTEDEVRICIDGLRSKYSNASHHCYAYVLYPDKSRFRANDDGEPSHSAGDPILGQIRSKDLTNVLVVVVRYFGGTKLGVSGLVDAYRSAAELALTAATIVERKVMQSIVIDYDYTATPEVMKLVKSFSIDIQEQTFLTRCTLRGVYPLELKTSLENRLELLSSLGHDITIL
jgi:uncharacterized YigZ family protein